MFQSKKCTDDVQWSAVYGLHKSGVGLMYQPCTCIGLAVLSIQHMVAGAFAVVLVNVITRNLDHYHLLLTVAEAHLDW